MKKVSTITLFSVFIISLHLNSCQTSYKKERYWEISCNIINDGAIWVPLNIKDKEYYANFDSAGKCIFSTNHSINQSIDSSQLSIDKRIYTPLDWSERYAYNVPVNVQLGNKNFICKFLRVPQRDTCMLISTDLIANSFWYFNLKDQTLEVSNKKKKISVLKQNSFKQKLSHSFGDVPSCIIPISISSEKKEIYQRFVFDTGNSAEFLYDSNSHFMDVSIVVNDLERYYSRKSFFSSLKKDIQYTSFYEPHRADVYKIDTFVLNGKKYTDFRVAIVEIPEAKDFSEYMVLLGMGFVNRFSNMIIDRKQVILYNEE